MKKQLLILLSALTLLSGCATLQALVSQAPPYLQELATMALDRDIRGWDNKTLEEQREILVEAKSVEGIPEELLTELDRQIAKVDTRIARRDAPPPEPDPEVNPAPPSSGIPSGSQVFLWKPVSERGSLVVLVPNEFYETYSHMEISGGFGSERGTMTGRDGNGNRPHFRWPHSGAAYGTNITATLTLKDGSIETWFIPDGSQRHEFR